jgi:hypothetical protein
MPIMYLQYVTQVCLCVKRGVRSVGNVFKKKGAEPSFCKNETRSQVKYVGYQRRFFSKNR